MQRKYFFLQKTNYNLNKNIYFSTPPPPGDYYIFCERFLNCTVKSALLTVPLFFENLIKAILII